MRMKSFFADTIEQAINLARREMGADAMLVNSKRSGMDARHLGAFEVVCATETEIRPRHTERLAASAKAVAASQAPNSLVQEVSELKQQLERLALTMARSGAGMAGIASDPDLAKTFATLTAMELDADLVYDLIGRLRAPITANALRAEIGRMIRVEPELGRPDSPQRIVALVGPPGAGKTTAVVKLAVKHGLLARRPTQILTLDTLRIAAADELRSYAAILGIGFQAVETTAALAQALNENRSKGLVLIDTPGLSQCEMGCFEEFAGLLATYPGIDTHLVLSASMRARDLKRVAGQYTQFGPGKILFTHLDETETFGPILGQSVRMGKPLSYLSWGQRIPEDLEAASKERILDLILKAEVAEEPRFGTAAA
jgi:flagellar biosynthesis protein FlhF